jgi:mRNA-degrading endonuclease RelE of RelBE toxin-antitoxin system
VYRILLDGNAEKQLDAFQLKDFERISEAVARLKENPRPGRVEKLKGRIYRTRSGRYWVIYTILDNEKLILIHEVVLRREDTYKKYR